MIDPQRRRVLQTLGIGTAALVGGVGTAAAEGKRNGASGDDTIVDVAVAADDFDVLVAAVQEAGLADALRGNRQWTVFAPTDDAFNAADITADNVGDVDDEFLFNVLTYHVTPGRRYAASVVNPAPVEMLNGESVTTDGTDLNDGQASIVDTNIEASNGVIHPIDGVLLP